MIIKKFQGKTENEAVESAKKELGNGVVIMNVRNVKRKGALGFLKKQLVEVTVALEEESERYIPVKRENDKKETEAEQRAEAQPLVAAIAKERPRQDNTAIEEKLDSLHSLLEQQLQKPEENKEKEEEISQEEKKPDELEKFMKLLYNTMLDNEVNETYANQIIDEMEKMNKPGLPFDYALANVYQKMILNLN